MREVINTFPEKFRNDIEKASEILKSHGCGDIYVFGSIANGKFDENSDIDIAVRGLEDSKFFRVLAELNKALSSPIDLIDLDDKQNRFAQFILKQEGLVKVA